jgi:RNA polymerase sigma factor (sigma-70 family)
VESFERLAEQYEPMIRRIIHSLHLYKNEEEYYQHALIALWEASERFDPEKGSFMNYAYSYIKGKCLTELRKSALYNRRWLYLNEEFRELLEDSSPLLPFLDEVLRSGSDPLTPKQRKWLIYTVQYGLSVKEIAEQEKVSVSAVKQWRAGAREKLKVLMDN